jgi:hypothetical protein
LLADYASFAAALLRSHIFLFEAMIAFSPAALSLRFGFCASARADAVFFVTADVAIAALAALAFFRFAASVALAAADIFRLGFGAGVGAGAAGSGSPLIFAHLAFCAKAILRRAAGLKFLRFPGPASVAAVVSTEPPVSMARSSAI